ncbi:MAG: hypothetical protein HQ591_02680 [candidate division Zixibacteria bacterium]|nr:hypothetical protein [Candidatus Tariuqbacter arcticus]
MSKILSHIVVFCLLLKTIVFANVLYAGNPPPVFPEIEGWELSNEILTFHPGNLYEYINGAAESYLDYHFQELKAAEYIRGSNESVTVEIYRFETLNHSFGIYSQERSKKGNFLNIGAEGYIEAPILNFLKGQYYIKIGAFGQDAKLVETLMIIAESIDRGLEAEAFLPRILTCFPKKYKGKNSESFIAKNFLGHSFLSNAFTAEYYEGEDIFELFIIQMQSARKCRLMLRNYLNYLKSTKHELQECKYELIDPYNGLVTLFWKGNIIWGGIQEGGVRTYYLSEIENLLKENGFFD